MRSSDGTLIVGRGVPDSWITPGHHISVTNFPTTAGRRARITVTSADKSVTLTVGGAVGRVRFELPAFVGNIASATRGTVNDETGTVVLHPSERSTTVHLRHAVG